MKKACYRPGTAYAQEGMEDEIPDCTKYLPTSEPNMISRNRGQHRMNRTAEQGQVMPTERKSTGEPMFTKNHQVNVSWS